MVKKSLGLYIDESLALRVSRVAMLEKRSWNQMATILIERGLEAQPLIVEELASACRSLLCIVEREDTITTDIDGVDTFVVKRARAVLAAFEVAE